MTTDWPRLTSPASPANPPTDYARLIQTPLCLGWPVALTIGGDLTSHAVIATGFKPATGETQIFNGYDRQDWNTLPNIYVHGVGDYTKIYGLLVVRPPCEAGKIWAAVTGTVTAKSDLPNVSLTWAPELPNRDYRIQGKATLDGDWQDDPGEDARFFRVTVDNPAN